MKKYIGLGAFIISSISYIFFYETYNGMMIINKFFWNSRPLVYEILFGVVIVTGILTGIYAIKNLFSNKLYFFTSTFCIVVVTFLIYLFESMKMFD